MFGIHQPLFSLKCTFSAIGGSGIRSHDFTIILHKTSPLGHYHDPKVHSRV